MMTEYKKNIEQSGFTLIEVMVTLVVAALALLAYIGGNVMVGQTSEVAYERSVAMQDAQRVIEQIRNTAVSGTFPGNVTAAYPNGASVSGFTNLNSEQVTVSYVNTTANPLDATVTVTWNANGTRSSATSLRTLVTQRVAG